MNSPTAPRIGPDARVPEASVLRCSCCGNLEIRLGDRGCMAHPEELLLLLDWLDALEDAPVPPRGPFVHYRPQIRFGETTLAVRPSELPRLRTLLEETLDLIDRAGPTSVPWASPAPYPLN